MSNLIVKINDNISISADGNQYIVRTNNNSGYFGSLDACFIDIFETLVMIRLSANQKKEIGEIARIVLDTKQEILDIMKPFVDLKV